MCPVLCTTGTYLNYTAKECQPCYEGCENCWGPKIFDCRTCREGYYFYMSQCMKTCPEGNYPNSLKRNCQECNSNCASCVTGTWCNMCEEPYFLNMSSGECVVSCPAEAGYYFTKDRKCYHGDKWRTLKVILLIVGIGLLLLGIGLYKILKARGLLFKKKNATPHQMADPGATELKQQRYPNE